jgi:hypothetical protein
MITMGNGRDQISRTIIKEEDFQNNIINGKTITNNIPIIMEINFIQLLIKMIR